MRRQRAIQVPLLERLFVRLAGRHEPPIEKVRLLLDRPIACGIMVAVSEQPPIIETNFELGFIGITPGIQSEIATQEIINAIRRHALCDWGELDDEDIEANEWSLKNSARLFSAYRSSTRVKFYVITEADRSSTTVLLPSEY